MLPRIERVLSDWLAAGARGIGQIDIHSDGPRFCLCHEDDVGRSGLQVHSSPQEAIELAKFDNHGNYRPLKTAPNLRHGWELQLPDLVALQLALDFFYPGRVAALAACQIDQGAQLWVLDRAGVLHSTYQTTPAGTWSPWDPPGYQGKAPGWHRTGLLKAVTAARQPGGETAIWVVDTASKLHHAAHKAGAWRDWSPPFKS